MNAPITVSPQATPAGGDPALTAPDEAPVAAPRRSHTIRRWVVRFISLVATLAVVGIVGLALALTAVPAAVGGHALTVLSGSMVPEFSPGAMVVDRPAPTSSLRVGDIVTYATTDEVSGAPILITHRIVEVQAGPTFITQGDANNSPDSRPVTADQVRGKVWYSVPYVGTARNFLLAQGAGLIVGGAAGLILAVWLLLQALKPDSAPTEPTDEQRAGRHRARNGASAAALIGLLATGTQLVSHQPATLAAFSDQQTVQFQITVGSAAAADSAPAAETVSPSAPTGNSTGSGTPTGEAASSQAPAGETADNAPPAELTTESATPTEAPVSSATPTGETAAGATPEETAGSGVPAEEPAPQG
jgi:signal peptidase I